MEQAVPLRNIFTFYIFTSHFLMALVLLHTFSDEESMTRAQWLLLGAIGLGLAIVIYFVFFCPVDCR